MKLRDYQAKVIKDLWQWFNKTPEGHPIVEACVGAGKSVMIAALCQEALTSWPGTRILMAVASRELCAQNLEKLKTVWPQAPAGVHSAGLGRKDLGHDILYATIGSIAKKAHCLGRVDLLLIDECHNVNAKKVGMYHQLIRELSIYNPHMRVIGWTGTAFRGNGVWLTASEDPIFTHIAARVTMADLLKREYLAPLALGKASTLLKADGVKMNGGDFVVSDLAKKINTPDLVGKCADELVRLAADRRCWLVYGVTIDHAQSIHAALTYRGIPCAVVTSETPAGQRDRAIRGLKEGRLRALVNVAVLTTGFDVPAVDCIALLRNTRSPVLYVQIAGRGMRTTEGKTDCLWLDFTDTTAVLGPVDQIKGRVPKPKTEDDKDAPPPVKHCEECGNPNPTGASVCEHCGTPFPETNRINHSDTVSQAQPLACTMASSLEKRAVDSITFRHYTKPGKPDSVLAQYWDGHLVVAKEWVCLEHEGMARRKAVLWMALFFPKLTALPKTVPEFLEIAGPEYQEMTGSKLHRLNAVFIKKDGKYESVVRYSFNEDTE